MTLSVIYREITEMSGSIMNDFVDAGFVHLVTDTLTLMTKNEIGRLAVINDVVTNISCQTDSPVYHFRALGVFFTY